MGSAGDELRLLDFTSLQISVMDTLLKLTSSGGDCTSVRTRRQGGAILARIFPIFSTKNDEKSWHVASPLRPLLLLMLILLTSVPRLVLFHLLLSAPPPTIVLPAFPTPPLLRPLFAHPP